MLRLHGLLARLHQEETPGAVRILDHARFRADLSEEGGLLISGDARDGDVRHERAVRGPGVDLAGRADLGQKAAGHPENIEEFVVPLVRVDVVEQGAGGVCGVRYVDAARRHVPDQPGIYGAESQFAPFRFGPRSGYVVEQPADFGSREVGVQHEARPVANQVGVPGFPEPVAHACGAAVLPYDGVMNGFAGAAVPYDGRFPLVCDADGGYVGGGEVCARQRFGGYARLGRPYFLRIVLDPARLRENLPEFALRYAPDCPAAVEQHGPGTGCALIEGENISWIGHGSGAVCRRLRGLMGWRRCNIGYPAVSSFRCGLRPGCSGNSRRRCRIRSPSEFPVRSSCGV